MCKYINFNNLRKKKGFRGGSWMKLTFVETQKNSQKNKQKKKKEKTQKTIYSMTNKKIMKTSFYCYKKSDF